MYECETIDYVFEYMTYSHPFMQQLNYSRPGGSKFKVLRPSAR